MKGQEVLRQISETLLWSFGVLTAACLGEQEKARAALDSLRILARATYVAPIWFAEAHAALGDVDEAFRWLQRADENRDFNLLFSINAPYWWLASVQEDPRFVPLVRKLGLQWPAPKLKQD